MSTEIQVVANLKAIVDSAKAGSLAVGEGVTKAKEQLDAFRQINEVAKELVNMAKMEGAARSELAAAARQQAAEQRRYQDEFQAKVQEGLRLRQVGEQAIAEEFKRIEDDKLRAIEAQAAAAEAENDAIREQGDVLDATLEKRNANWEAEAKTTAAVKEQGRAQESVLGSLLKMEVIKKLAMEALQIMVDIADASERAARRAAEAFDAVGHSRIAGMSGSDQFAMAGGGRFIKRSELSRAHGALNTSGVGAEDLGAFTPVFDLIKAGGGDPVAAARDLGGLAQVGFAAGQTGDIYAMAMRAGSRSGRDIGWLRQVIDAIRKRFPMDPVAQRRWITAAISAADKGASIDQIMSMIPSADSDVRFSWLRNDDGAIVGTGEIDQNALESYAGTGNIEAQRNDALDKAIEDASLSPGAAESVRRKKAAEAQQGVGGFFARKASAVANFSEGLTGSPARGSLATAAQNTDIMQATNSAVDKIRVEVTNMPRAILGQGR